MRKKWLILSLIILFILILLSLFYYLTHRNRQNDTLILYGNVDVRQVDIGFRVAGQVEELVYEEGALVPQGALMARLNQTPYISQVEEAKAKVATTTTQLKNAEILLKRRQELIGSGSVSQEDLDDASTNYNSLLSTLAANNASLAIAQDNLSYTEAFAPTEGILLTRIREPGTVVNPSDPVYTLSLRTPLWIRAYVSEPDLGRIYYGMKAEVSTDTADAPTYTGIIGFISPVAEFTPKTVQTTELRTELVYRLRIYVDHPDNRLKQGMPVTVRISTRTENE